MRSKAELGLAVVVALGWVARKLVQLLIERQRQQSAERLAQAAPSGRVVISDGGGVEVAWGDSDLQTPSRAPPVLAGGSDGPPES